MKNIRFIGTSRTDLSAFPELARKDAGYELWRVQCGRMPTDWKPMPGVGVGAMEIRIQWHGAWRVIYVAKFDDDIFVLHSFEKKTNKTSKKDIEIAKHRYHQIRG